MKKTIVTLIPFLLFFISNSLSAQVAGSLTILDTRSANEIPNFYNHSIRADFKLRDVIGVPGQGVYSTTLSLAQWDSTNNSGDKNHQLNFNNGGIFYRNAYPLDPQWSNWQQILMADSNGNVGIGSILPNAPLDIVSNSSSNGIIIRKRASNDYGNILFYDNSGSTGLAGIGVASNRIRIMSGGLSDAYERFSITSSGLVGINSISPLNTFEVKVATSTGTSSSDGISIHDGAVYRLGINIGVNTAGEYSYLQAVKGGIGQKSIVINPTGGNVGIGITNPQNKLDINGTVHSKEVKVDMIGWPDFVFKKEYNLPTLEEVEKHIKEKGRLENIPSQDEVLKNGINLGEMNAKLLQKIEELTLYSIGQNKKIETQSKEIEIMKKENENFKLIFERLSKIEDKLK